MRSYTNKDGELIKVSEQHLQTAVKIKKELQKLSTSNKASLKKLVQMMEREGFYDAEASEAYRCMLKAYQKSIGELPKAEEVKNEVITSKLNSIKEQVGEMRYEKHEIQHSLRELNRIKRDIMDAVLMAEQVGLAFASHDFSDLKFEPELKSVSETDTEMIACLSDMHIGAKVDTDINNYNYGIAIGRLSDYAHRIIKESRIHNISTVHVVNLGDVIEHSGMRFAQAFDVEFPFSEQIVKASDIIIKFLIFLVRAGLNVSYAGIAGNHDRIADKDKNINGDHAVKAINYAIKTFIENAEIKGITYVEANDYSHSLTVNGANFKFVHGDLDSVKDENVLSKHCSLDGIDYDMLVMGHYHHFREVEVGFDKRIVTFGSLKGADDYGMKIRKVSSASQGIIIVDDKGDIDVKRIKLD